MSTVHGAQVWCSTTDEPLDVAASIAAVATPASGAVASFLGTVRTPNAGHDVAWIDYEGYTSMIHAEMQRIAAEQVALHRLSGLAIRHRLGRCLPGEASIAIVACSRHRTAALDAVRDTLEACKARLPIWKLERTDDGDRWVEGTTLDDATIP